MTATTIYTANRTDPDPDTSAWVQRKQDRRCDSGRGDQQYCGSVQGYEANARRTDRPSVGSILEPFTTIEDACPKTRGCEFDEDSPILEVLGRATDPIFISIVTNPFLLECWDFHFSSLVCSVALDVQQEAEARAERRFPSEEDELERNAFQHALGSALLMGRLRDANARRLTEALEESTAPQDPLDTAADLINNERGFRLFPHAATVEELDRLVYDATIEGYLACPGSGDLVPCGGP